MSAPNVIPLHDRRRALAVQNLAQAGRHRDVAAALARGALDAVAILAAHAVTAGGLDRAGALGLQLAVFGARDAAAELAEAQAAVDTAAGDVDHA